MIPEFPLPGTVVPTAIVTLPDQRVPEPSKVQGLFLLWGFGSPQCLAGYRYLSMGRITVKMAVYPWLASM